MTVYPIIKKNGDENSLGFAVTVIRHRYVETFSKLTKE